MKVISIVIAALLSSFWPVVLGKSDDTCLIAPQALESSLLQLSQKHIQTKILSGLKDGSGFDGAMSFKHILVNVSHTLVSSSAQFFSQSCIMGGGAILLLGLLLLSIRGIPEKSKSESRSEELPWSTFLIFTLAFAGMGFCTDQFIPSLPAMAVEFGVSEEVMSTSLQVNWATAAMATCIAGMLSDRLGRRTVMLSLLFTLTVSTAACSCAPTFGWFLAGRILQGIGESGGAVVLATFRDYYDDPVRRATLFGWVEMIKMVGPVIAPPVGGIVASFVGWRVLFICLSVFNASLLILSLISMEESVTQACDNSVWSDLVRVLSDRHRIIIIVANSFLNCYFLTFLSTISYVYEGDYSLPLFSSSLLIGLLALAVMPGIGFTQILLQFQGDVIKSANVGYLALSLPIIMTFFGFLLSTGVAYYTLTLFMAHLLCMTPIIAMDTLFAQDLKDSSGTAMGIAWSIVGVASTSLSVLGSFAGSHGSRTLMLAFTLELVIASIVYWLGFGLSPPKWALVSGEDIKDEAYQSSAPEGTKGSNSSSSACDNF